ncbi:SNF2 family N-terminal domain-containing protein [Roridomyces roridus]|uniref:SNF2 family N-terminal domain-containing protein n=1 Tax=Roridomyces roridus TaxID=1738132 RepID=A0AAD7F7D8_9AGAR|nr:SNF2 family N-terminal domain-containing protein [Roridomyces roridus]
MMREPKEDSKDKAPVAKKKTGDEKKQMSLAAMLMQPAKAKIDKKTDKYPFGRLPQDISSWMAKLLDLGIVEFRGKMMDCPEKPSTGATLVVTADIYITRRANTDAQNGPVVMFSEGAGTMDEKMLRERKASILNLRPHRRANFVGRKSDEEMHQEALEKMAKNKNKKVMEIVGDGEEIEVEEGEELNKNDLGMIYKKAQKSDRTISYNGPNGALRHVHIHASRIPEASASLGKMDAREANSMHPLEALLLYPYSGEVSLEFPKAERKGQGGILADGKKWGSERRSCSPLSFTPTEIQTPPNNLRKSPPPERSNPASSNSTPPLTQWGVELLRSCKPGTLKVLLWHGQNRLDLEDVLEDEDEEEDGLKPIKVVITSYGALASEHAKFKSPVFEVEWFRVVLDEAQSCNSRSSKTAKAVYGLNARRRWAVMGTPIFHKLEDLYSLLKFLDFRPWSDFSFFRSFITLPFLARDPKAIEIFQIILESILLRREKSIQDANGKPIVQLPDKEVTIEYLEFTPMERKIYASLFNSAKRDFQRLDAKGLVGKNYILAMLMRLQRAVLHLHLVLSADDERTVPDSGGSMDVNEMIERFANDDVEEGSSNGNVFAQKALENLDLDKADSECPICTDVMASPMLVPECMHRFCKDCLNDFRSSTKLDVLVRNLRQLREQDPCFRVVVFSQFTSFLDLIQIVLKRERFENYRFDGSMDVKKRGVALDEFREPTRRPKVLVMIPYLTSPKAVDRVHRIGQDKTVYVKHFIVSNTIEGTAIVKEAFQGSRKKDTDPESIENLKIMFGEDD